MIIGWLKGRVISFDQTTLLIEVGGVGYVLIAGNRLLSKVQAGDQVELHVETQVTENAIRMYAFLSELERAWFCHIQNVQGIGGKAALAILDAVSPTELRDAISLGDSAPLTRAQGVGKKLAERIVRELASKPYPLGRVGSMESVETSDESQAQNIQMGGRDEAISALVNLGYTRIEAGKAVATVVKKVGSDDVGELIRAALQELGS